jgi:hypothetical protein
LIEFITVPELVLKNWSIDMQKDDVVIDVKSKQRGRIIESRLFADGFSTSSRYLVNFNGLEVWKEESEIMQYITNEGTEYGGEFLTEG